MRLAPALDVGVAGDDQADAAPGQGDVHVSLPGRRLAALGVTSYGQMTAGSYMYIGPQGIVHGTTITILGAGRQYLGATGEDGLAGKVLVTSGLGGMSGAEGKAAVIAGKLREEGRPRRGAPFLHPGQCRLAKSRIVLAAARDEQTGSALARPGLEIQKILQVPVQCRIARDQPAEQFGPVQRSKQYELPGQSATSEQPEGSRSG